MVFRIFVDIFMTACSISLKTDSKNALKSAKNINQSQEHRSIQRILFQ